MDTFINLLFVVLMLLIFLFIVYFMIKVLSFVIKQQKKTITQILKSPLFWLVMFICILSAIGVLKGLGSLLASYLNVG